LAVANSTYYNRESFEKVKSEIEFPDLLDVQIEAFQSFIQENIPEDERIDLGLQEYSLE
jgi:DNA-directed RNA polymerase subunit beta